MMEGGHSHPQPLPQQTQSQQVMGVDSSNAVYANSQPSANGTVYTNNQATHTSNNAVYSNNQTATNQDVFSNNNGGNHGNSMPPGGVAYNPVRRYSEPVNMITPIPIPRTNPQQWLGMSLEYLGINPGTTFIQQPLQGSPEHSRRRLPERRLPPTPEESDLSVILASNNRKLVKASGASTVAIDNKIEQAMDLVKSHLMFAVREEVEVLKEQIKELLEKNNQLEYENSILKAAATPETMTKLQQSQPPTSAS